MRKGIPVKGREIYNSRRCENNSFLGNGERKRKKGQFDSSVEIKRAKTRSAEAG